ncbi:MAG: hypothetical protein AAFN74_09200 [Myxococcota bacterium]
MNPFSRGASIAGLALLLVAVSIPRSAGAFNASAWTRPKAEVWSLVSFGYVAGRTQFLPDRSEVDFIQGIDDRNTFEDASFYAQLQLGLFNGLTLNTTLPFKRVFIEQQAFFTETQALGDVYFGLRAGIFELAGIQSPVAWSVEVGANLPTGYTRNLAPSVGPGNIDVEIKTAFGYGFRPFSWLPAYAQLGVGLRIRTGIFALSSAAICNLTSDIDCVVDTQPDYSEEIIYLGELGVTPLGGSLLLFGKVFGAHSIPTPEVGFTAANPIPERQRYVKAGFGGAVYPAKLAGFTTLERLGVIVQHYWTVDGQNAPRTNDLFVGLEMTYGF